MLAKIKVRNLKVLVLLLAIQTAFLHQRKSLFLCFIHGHE